MASNQDSERPHRAGKSGSRKLNSERPPAYGLRDLCDLDLQFSLAVLKPPLVAIAHKSHPKGGPCQSFDSLDKPALLHPIFFFFFGSYV